MLDVVLIAPTVRPMLVSALDAVAWLLFVTSGTATCGRPEEITRATALPTTTSAPAAGFWLITEPAGTVMLDAVVTVPRTSCAPVIAADAASCIRPTTPGALTCGKPVDTV